MNAMNNICLFGQPIYPLEVGEVEVEAITRIVHLYLCKYRNNTNTQTTIPIRHNKTNMLEIFWKQNSTTVHTHIHWIWSSQISLKFLSLLPNERLLNGSGVEVGLSCASFNSIPGSYRSTCSKISSNYRAYFYFVFNR